MKKEENMKSMTFSKGLLFVFLFFLLLGISSSVTIAEAARGRSEINNTGYLADVQLESSEPTPNAPEVDEEGLYDISSTASITVSLGAWRNYRPTESYLYDISMLPSEYQVDCTSSDQKSEGWIVGSGGVILNYCNGVWDHAIVVESVPTDLWGVQAISPTLGVAVGQQGTVLMYLYDEIALDWVWVKSPIPVGNELLRAVSMVPLTPGSDTYVGWAVGTADTEGRGTLIYGEISPKSGSSPKTYTYEWTNLTANFMNLPEVDFLSDVQMLSPNNGWAVGGKAGERGVIYHWNGSNWTLYQEVGDKILLGIHMIGDNDGWIVGREGVIYHYDGSSWSQVPSPTTERLMDVGFKSKDEGWAVGFNGTLLHYEDDEWSVFDDLRSDPYDYHGVDFNSGHGWVMGHQFERSIGGHIAEFEDGLWLPVTMPTDNRLNDVAITSINDAWAVGNYDELGGTIVHWDGAHWQRWFQHDLPLPSVDLFAIDMASADDGWAAGKPLVDGEPAVFLHWDGHRWAEPRYDAPVNVQVNDLRMLNNNFGWAVANNGNAVAKYFDDGINDFWSANHTCGGIFYNLRSLSVVSSTNSIGWDGWTVGTSLNPATGEYFLQYTICGTSYAWERMQQPIACEPANKDGPKETKLRGVSLHPESWAFSAGNYRDRASIYYYDGSWNTAWCMPADSKFRPSQLNSVDIVEESGVSWFGGFRTIKSRNRKEVLIRLHDGSGQRFGGIPFPLNGVNIYHRPISRLEMLSDTMGWAVGEAEDPDEIGVIYQYPYPNFTLDSQPEMQAVIPGGTTNFTVTVGSIGGFNAQVDLSLGLFPETITATVVPDSINADQPAVIEITTTEATPLGEYELPVWGYAEFRSGDNWIPVWREFNLKLTVTNTPVYDVSPDRGPAGTEVTIRGENFGADPGSGNRSDENNHVILAGEQMPDASVTSWNDTEIKVVVPDDVLLFEDGPTYGEVRVAASGSDSNDNHTFQLENYLESLETQSSAGMIEMTLNGTSFGEDPGHLFRSTTYEHVSLSGIWIPNGDVISWDNNRIVVQIPQDADTGYISVTANGYQSNALLFQSSNRYVYLPLLSR
jgi:photosystem II stability/assembly factor-like uncharacterized protein